MSTEVERKLDGIEKRIKAIGIFISLLGLTLIIAGILFYTNQTTDGPIYYGIFLYRVITTGFIIIGFLVIVFGAWLAKISLWKLVE
jgi:uncharacterized membrane protein